MVAVILFPELNRASARHVALPFRVSHARLRDELKQGVDGADDLGAVSMAHVDMREPVLDLNVRRIVRKIVSHFELHGREGLERIFTKFNESLPTRFPIALKLLRRKNSARVAA